MRPVRARLRFVVNRPRILRAVAALLSGVVLLLAGCQPGPPPTPTLPPSLDFTVTPTWQSPTPSVTPIPSITASLTPVAPTRTVPPSETPVAQPVTIATVTPTATATAVRVTIPPPLDLVTAAAPQVLAAGADSMRPAVGVVGQPVQGAQSVQPVNSGFDGEAEIQGSAEIVVPVGWTAWWREGGLDCSVYLSLGTTGPCPAYDMPEVTYKRPEFSVIPAEGRWLDPPRVVGAGRGARFFCTYGICEGGYFQQVLVEPGLSYSLGAQVHAWCTQNTADPYHSQLDTLDDRLNCALSVGLDPTGGLDPWSPNIVWQTVTAYDVFQMVNTPAVQAQGGTMTLFLRGRSLWAMRHNDFHFDQVTFERR